MLREFLVYNLIVLVKQLLASFFAPDPVMDAKLLLSASPLLLLLLLCMQAWPVVEGLQLLNCVL
jgi:hypothetical protein